MFTEEHFKRLDEIFGVRVERAGSDLIHELQNRLNPEQWVVYINELELLMRDDIEEHMTSLKNASLERGRIILFLKAEPKHRLEALMIAMEIWF